MKPDDVLNGWSKVDIDLDLSNEMLLKDIGENKLDKIIEHYDDSSKRLSEACEAYMKLDTGLLFVSMQAKEETIIKRTIILSVLLYSILGSTLIVNLFFSNESWTVRLITGLSCGLYGFLLTYRTIKKNTPNLEGRICVRSLLFPLRIAVIVCGIPMGVIALWGAMGWFLRLLFIGFILFISFILFIALIDKDD